MISPSRRALLVLTALQLLLAGRRADAQGLSIMTTPRTIILGQTTKATIMVKGLPGKGPARAAVNVGHVRDVTTLRGRVRVQYDTPSEGFPQRLCLLLWRRGEPGVGVRVARIPLLGQTIAPVKTRKNSQVTLTVGGRVFGPKSSGPHGRVRIRVVVAPGISQGKVEVIDAKGMETQKTVSIQLAPYNPLAIAVEPRRSEAKQPVVRLTVATSEVGLGGIKLQVRPPGGEETMSAGIPLEKKSNDRWTATWMLDEKAPRGRYVLLARVPGDPQAIRAANFTWEAKPAAPPPPVVKKEEPPPVEKVEKGFFDELSWDVSIAGGLMHNIGELVSPRLSAEAGADHALGPGRIGARLMLGVGWGSQEITGQGSAEATTSSVLLLPMGVGVTYRLPLGLITPHATAGPVVQLIRTNNDGDSTGRVARTDVSFGVLGRIGASLRLGPGGLILQTGYQWSLLDNDDVKLQAGGLFVEAGYRLHL